MLPSAQTIRNFYAEHDSNQPLQITAEIWPAWRFRLRRMRHTCREGSQNAPRRAVSRSVLMKQEAQQESSRPNIDSVTLQFAIERGSIDAQQTGRLPFVPFGEA